MKSSTMIITDKSKSTKIATDSKYENIQIAGTENFQNNRGKMKYYDTMLSNVYLTANITVININLQKQQNNVNQKTPMSREAKTSKSDSSNRNKKDNYMNRLP